MLLLLRYENYKNGSTSFLICLLKKGYIFDLYIGYIFDLLNVN